MNKKIVKETLILCLITLVAGACLGAVEYITRNPIAKAKEEAKLAAYKNVFPEGEEFKTSEGLQNAVNNSQKLLEEKNIGGATIDEGVEVYSQEKMIGHIITVTSSEGYGGDITLAVAITTDGVVKGYEVLAISETPGLGMKAKEEEFKNQFENKTAGEFVNTKQGASKENEIDAISGATITTKAVVNCVNAACAFVLENGDNNE